MDLFHFVGKLVIRQVTETAVDKAVDKVLEPVPMWVYLFGLTVLLGGTVYGIFTFFSAIMN